MNLQQHKNFDEPNRDKAKDTKDAKVTKADKKPGRRKDEPDLKLSRKD